MRTKHEQISSCVILISPYRQNFDLAHTTISVIIIASIYFVTAYASIYTYFALAYKRICLPAGKDPSLHLSSVRHNDVASICTLTHCHTNPSKLSRPMDSFRHQPAQFIIRYDASLTGLGVGLYQMPNNRLVIYTALQLPFSVDNDSSNQNTMEFTAVVLG
jgi:hypothetical protein